MKTWKSRPILAVIGVLLLAFVGCSGDSPTEPSKPGSGTPTPPTDSVTVTVTVSGVTPSSAIVTATVDNGSAPDGTAVEFETGLGTFAESGTGYALRSTTGGKASVMVQAVGTEKSTVVRVRVRSTIVDRQVNYVTDEIPEGSPAISSVTPAKGSPTGGYVATITGRNFFEPVRVFFGDQEAVVASYTAETPSTPAVVKAVVPPINLNLSEQARAVAVTVIASAGTANEVSGSLSEGFRYELDILTPTIIAVSPSSGPNEGNTRITIFGEGFQSPLVAYFGSGNTRVDLELISISYNQIIAVTPPAAGMGSDFLNNSVTLTVHNIASNKTASLSSAFRYGPDIQITSISPTLASYLGGTRVTINGFGFDDPVAVVLDGVPAQIIRVSGTEIIAIATAPIIRDCQVQRSGGSGAGTVSVTNIETGSSAELSNAFSYFLSEPVITFVSPVPATEGQPLGVTILDPGIGNATFRVGERTAFPTPASATSAAGETIFQITVPAGLEYDTEDCTTGGGAAGTANAPTDFDLTFLNVITGCEASLDGGITVTPADTTCQAGPVGTVSPSNLAFPNTAVGVTSAPIAVTVGNIGSADLIILGISSSDAQFAAGPPASNTVPASGSTTFNVTFTPTAAAAASGTITISTNAGDLTVAVTGTGV